MSAPPSPDDSSPCVNICELSPDKSLCLGCGRSLSEIAGWLGFSAAERIAAKTAAAERLRLHKLSNG